MELPLEDTATIGFAGCRLSIGKNAPFLGFADSAMTSALHCDTAFEGTSLAQVNDGPLFTDYTLEYRYAEHRSYSFRFRCYRDEPYIEVAESFSLGMNAELVWTLNPEKRFTHIISRDSFEGETQYRAASPADQSDPSDRTDPTDLPCQAHATRAAVAGPHII